MSELIGADSIPAQFQEAGALFIEKKLFRRSVFSTKGFEQEEVFGGKLLFQSQEGISNHARIKIPLDFQLNIYEMDARILRNGRTIDLSAVQLERIFEYTEDQMVFKIPNIQIGDVVEWLVKRKGKKVDPGGNFFFHDQIPILESRLIITLPLNINLMVKQYNDIKEPQVNYRIEKKTYEWTIKNLQGLPAQTLAIPALSQPYISYNYDYKKLYPQHLKDETTWLNLLASIYTKELLVKEGKPQVLKDWYAERLALHSNANLSEQLRHIHHYINKNIVLKASVDNSAYRGLSYHLEKGEMDRITLLKLYCHLLERYRVQFYLAVGKNRYDGSLDLEFPDHAQIGELFFIFKNEVGKIRFLYPKTAQAYAFNKFPCELEGSTIFLYNPADSESLTKLKIPYSQPGANRIDRHQNIQVDLDNENLLAENKERYTGANALQTAAFFKQLKANNRTYSYLSRQLHKRIPEARLSLTEVSISDQVQDSSRFMVNYNWRSAEGITFVDSNLIRINIKNWFPHDFPPVDFDTQLLDVFPLFKGTDSYRYNLQFDRAVKLIGGENPIHIQNKTGEYFFRIFQETATSISIESRFGILSGRIPRERFQELAAFKEAISAQNALFLLIELEKNIEP